MTLLQSLLRITNFRAPLLRTLVPTLALSYGLQAAVAIPSVALQSERFYDFSGSVTYVACTALSLYLPHLRAGTAPLPSLASVIASSNWRQVFLSAAVVTWATRLGSYLLQRVLAEGKDSRFDDIKKSPAAFSAAFAAQATWVSVCLLPVVAVNAVPASAFAGAAGALGLADLLGLALFAGGFLFEVTADRQKARWVREKKAKLHEEEFMTRGLWARSQYPNYFGESTLWTGLATLSAGVLLRQPVQLATGLGPASALALCYASPAFVTFLLLRVSGVPLSEKKYDARYGHRADYQAWKRETPKFFPKVFQS